MRYPLRWGEHNHRLLLCLHTCEATDRFPSEDLEGEQLCWHGYSLPSGSEPYVLPWNPEMPADPLEVLLQNCQRNVASKVQSQDWYRSHAIDAFCIRMNFTTQRWRKRTKHYSNISPLVRAVSQLDIQKSKQWNITDTNLLPEQHNTYELYMHS